MRRVFGLRFLVEAAFIVDVATLVWYEDLSPAGIVGAIAGAWLLVSLVEWFLSRREGELPRVEALPPQPMVVAPVPGPEPEPEPEPEPAPEPEPEPEPEAPPPAAEPVVELPVRAEPREWNLWELERLARDTAGADIARDEERSFLLMYLREFADPDGMLPMTFDPLVREAFGDVLGAARP